ncbi:P-type conjugative transfer protein TrbL [Escherichia coli]
MRMPASLKFAVPLLLCLAFFSVDASAGTMNSSGLFDDVLNRYNTAASGWAGVVTDAATWLFWTLVVISMVWTFGMMALRKADIGEFFAEFVRFTIFVGFFWWLLINAPAFATSIFNGLRQVAGNATGLGSSLSPSGIVDIGFAIFYNVVDQSSIWSPGDSLAGILMAVAILVVLAIIGVNMLLLLASAWVLAYGGIFFLGFGGSRWTSDMAINYYKTVLGIAAQLMTMVFLIGIGKTFLDDYYSRMSSGISLKEMGVMLIVCVILLALVNKVPALVAGIITGASVGGVGIGQFGAGAAVGAAGMAAAAAATGGAMIAAGAANAAGGAQAVMAAFSKASDNVASGSDVLTSMWGGGGGDGDGGGGGGGGGSGSGGDSSTGSTPFAQAAGFSGSSSSSSGASSMSGGNEGGDATGRAESGSSSSDQAKGDGQKADNSATAQAAQGGQQSSAGQSGGFLAAAAKAGKIAADAGVNLAKGTADVAMSKAASMKESAMDRIADTAPGKVAAAIKGQGGGSTETNIETPQQQDGPTFAGNSLGGDDDAQSEVAAFVNRDNGNKSA